MRDGDGGGFGFHETVRKEQVHLGFPARLFRQRVLSPLVRRQLAVVAMVTTSVVAVVVVAVADVVRVAGTVTEVGVGVGGAFVQRGAERSHRRHLAIRRTRKRDRR